MLLLKKNKVYKSLTRISTQDSKERLEIKPTGRRRKRRKSEKKLIKSDKEKTVENKQRLVIKLSITLINLMEDRSRMKGRKKKRHKNSNI
jgi:hypothetical protein